jgi:Protein of unknown function (DUF3105)
VAKKKSRVPTPPRRVDAPKPRLQPQSPKRATQTTSATGARRTRLVFLGLGAALVAIAIVVGLVMALGGGENASAALAAAGCTEQSFPSQGRQHKLQLDKGFKYKSFPPTSGPHHPQPAIFNIYDRPVQQIHLVHNLEHGGVVVQYGDEVPQATIDEITAWYRSDPTALVVAPLPGLRDKIALTAWTQLATCPGFNEDAFDAFFDEHAFNGPERFPESRLQPGM